MRRERALDLGAVLAPGALAAGLSFYQLGTRSLWLDESASVTIAAQHGAALGAAMARDGGNMLAFYALLHVLIAGFGNGVIVIRTPSAVAAVATVVLVCVLAKRFFDRRVAVVSGLLTAVSLPLVYWGQDARAYAPMIAFVAASFLAFAAVLDAGPGTRSGRRRIVVYVVVTTLAMYMSFVTVLVVPAQLASLVCRRGRLRAAGAAVASTAVCCVPLAVLAHGRGSAQLFWVPKPNISAFDQVAEALTSAAFPPDFARTATSAALLWVSIVALVGAAFIAFRVPGRPAGGRAGGYFESRFPQVLLFAWLVVPVVLAGFESIVGQSIFTPRNLLVSLPPVSILFAWAAVGRRAPGLPPVPARAPAGTPQSLQRWGGAPGWLAVAVLLTLRALQLAPTYGVSPEDWKAATSFVVARAEPGDCIAFYPSDGEMAFEYYIGGSATSEARAPRPVLPVTTWGAVTPYVERYVTLSPHEIAAVSGSCRRLWLVASHQGLSDGPPVSVEHLRRYVRLQSALGARMSVLSASSFGYADPVDVELFSGRRR
jgi:hypothetical protein